MRAPLDLISLSDVGCLPRNRGYFALLNSPGAKMPSFIHSEEHAHAIFMSMKETAIEPHIMHWRGVSRSIDQTTESIQVGGIQLTRRVGHVV